jgi:hypothetical protein
MPRTSSKKTAAERAAHSRAVNARNQRNRRARQRAERDRAKRIIRSVHDMLMHRIVYNQDLSPTDVLYCAAELGRALEELERNHALVPTTPTPSSLAPGPCPPPESPPPSSASPDSLPPLPSPDSLPPLPLSDLDLGIDLSPQAPPLPTF